MHIINITSYICTLLFFIFLVVIYFTKKNADNVENKIYRQLLVWNFFLVFSCLCYFLIIPIFKDNRALASFICNIYQSTSVIWTYFILYYTFVISYSSNKKITNLLVDKNKIISNCIIFGILIIDLVLLIIFHSTTYFNAKGVLIGENGFVVLLINVFMYIPLVFTFIVFFVNSRKIENRKRIPFILGLLFVLLHTLIVIITGYYVTLAPVLTTLITYLMYFTIDNPDVKLIAELTLARDQAMKSNQAKSDFLSSMSHELRTPLNAILGLSQVMKENDNIEELHHDLDDIILSSEKLLELVDGILNINRLENNDIVINNANYNLKDVLDGLEEVVRLRIGTKNITYRQRISDDLPNVLYGDKEKVRTIINNLLTNAVKYTEEGLVELDISSFIVKDKCNLKISVSDTGQGIKEEDINNIFDKFYRSEENKDSDIEGTGLGLSITKSIIDLMDGRITVNSNYGEGTTFTVTISQKVVDNNQDIETL